MRINIEMTDTFGGGANYSWVKRETIELNDKVTDRQIVIACKKALGITGVKCDKEDFGDMIKLKIRKACVVVFITFE